MNVLQFRSILGYVHFSLEGDQLVQFVHLCQKESILLWDVSFIENNRIEAKIYVTDIKKIKKLADELNIDVEILSRKGISFYLVTIWNQKERVVAFLLSTLLLFYLSQTVWKVEINGVATHLEHEITERLQKFGVYQGAFRTSRLPVEQMEAHIMETLPELLYISVKKRGTIYTIEALEKQEEKLTENTRPTDLIARKSGIIQKMLVKEGQAVVHVNDFVKKGDLLVTGKMDMDDVEQEADESEDDEQNIKLVTSEGDVYANTWYEVEVSSNLQATYETLQGEKINHYFISVGNVNIPLFIWPKVKYYETEVNEEHIPLHILKKELPFSLKKRTSYAKKTVKLAQTEKEARQKGIDHALKDLKNKLGKETEIIKYYILHDVVDSGKVKLRLYVSVLENIAQVRPLAEKDE